MVCSTTRRATEAKSWSLLERVGMIRLSHMYSAPTWEYLVLSYTASHVGQQGWLVNGTPRADLGACPLLHAFSALGREGWEFAMRFDEREFYFKRQASEASTTNA